MTLMAQAIKAAEHFDLPDPLTLAGVGLLVRRTDEGLAQLPPYAETVFAEGMKGYPIATHTDEANAQHYELPAEFFALALGPRRKYSSCLYPQGNETLAQAEMAALEATVQHADLKDGQLILELGCGWGSLSLYMAETYPSSRIVAVSNSHSQRAYIEAQARLRGLKNLEVITANMVDFSPERKFDRIVSVEMFEHMSNWHGLLTRTREWLLPEGLLFIHVFTHRNRSYRFNANDRHDWIAQYFFSGGVMPSHELIWQFGDIYSVVAEWRWSGTHYEKTALHWLENYDRNKAEIMRLLTPVYGSQARVWFRRWRLFFLATAGLFGHDEGKVWGVSHYRLRPA